MNEDKIFDKLTDGITKAVTGIFLAVLSFFLISAATATDPFFRKRMGERYFTPIRYAISALGWWVVLGIPFAPYYATYGATAIHEIPLKFQIGGMAILLGYLIVGRIQLLQIRRRRRAGEVWHSRSKGESVFGNENQVRDFIVDMVVTLALGFGLSWWYGGFFFLSRLLGYMADAMARAQLYNKYLDIMDAKIDAQFMEVALRDGLAPSETGGLFHPLSKGFTPEQRANVARVIATSFVPGPTPNSGPSPQSQTFTSAPPPSPEPRTTTPQKPFPTAKVVAVLALLLVAVALFAGAQSLVHAIHLHRSAPVVSTPLQPDTQPPTVAATALTPVAPTPPLASPSPVTDTPPPVAMTAAPAPLAVATPAPVVDLLAEQRAAEAKQRLEQREAAIRQATDALAGESDAFYQFKTNCETRIADETNRIAHVRSTYQDNLTHRVVGDIQFLAQLEDVENRTLTHESNQLTGIPSDQQLDTSRLNSAIQSKMARFQKARQMLTQNLDDLDAAIADSPTNFSLSSLFHN